MDSLQTTQDFFNLIYSPDNSILFSSGINWSFLANVPAEFTLTIDDFFKTNGIRYDKSKHWGTTDMSVSDLFNYVSHTENKLGEPYIIPTFLTQTFSAEDKEYWQLRFSEVIENKERTGWAIDCVQRQLEHLNKITPKAVKAIETWSYRYHH